MAGSAGDRHYFNSHVFVGVLEGYMTEDVDVGAVNEVNDILGSQELFK